MTNLEYIDLILTGLVNHRDFLSDFFYRELKTAEKLHVSEVEYFARLNNANKIFLDDIKRSYYERIKEVAMIESIWKKEGKSLEDLEGQKPNLSNFSVHLHSLTNGKYAGHLWIADLDYIQQAIIKAIGLKKAEIDSLLSKNAIAKDSKEQLYDTFSLLTFFLLPDVPGEGFYWLDKDNKLTYNINELVSKQKIEIPRQRTAQNENDFKIIFERELSKASIENNVETKEFYAPLLIQQVESYVEQHKKGRSFDTWDMPLLLISQRFALWLKDEIDHLKIAEKNPKDRLHLINFFEDISKYHFIIKLLVDNNHCQEKTFIWKDEGKGNKGFLACIIKYLHKQGYYKENKPLNNSQIKEIALNTFGVDIGIDTIKKANCKHFNVEFIPASIAVFTDIN